MARCHYPVGGMNGWIRVYPVMWKPTCSLEITSRSATFQPKAEGHPTSRWDDQTVQRDLPGAVSFPTGKFVSVSDNAEGYSFNEVAASHIMMAASIRRLRGISQCG